MHKAYIDLASLKRKVLGMQPSQLESLSEDRGPRRARGFCATLSKGDTQSLRSNDLEDFSPLIEKASIAWVDYIVGDFEKEAVEAATKFGFSDLLVTQLLKNTRSGYEDFDIEMGVLLPAFQVKGFDIVINPLLILLKKGLIMTIRDRETIRLVQIRRYAETYMRNLPKNLKHEDWLTLLLIRIIDESKSKNFEQLRAIEEGSEDLTQDLKGDSVPSPHVLDQIYQMKHALLQYLSGLWATSDTLSSLRYGDADLISDKTQVLDKIGLLASEVHTQLSLAEHLSEVLASGLETQHEINNSRLQDLANQLQDKNNQLQDFANKLQEYNNQLQEKNNNLQDKANQLQDINNQLQVYNNRLQEKNNDLQDVNNQLSDRNNQLSDFNNQLTLRNNQLTAKNNQLTALNNRLTFLGGVLAILAAGFVVPNTIATVLSQTNIFLFGPEATGWYITLIVTSTIFTSVLVWLLLRRKGLLPKIEEEQPIEAQPPPNS